MIPMTHPTPVLLPMVEQAAREAARQTFDALPGVVSADLLVHGFKIRAYPDGRLEVIQ